MIKRILPRSLIGQISLVMLAGLLLVLMVSAQIYSNERDQALDLVSSETTLARVGALINVLNRTPGNLHNEIIAASQGAGFALSLDPEPIITTDQRPDLTSQLMIHLSQPVPREIRLQSVLTANNPHLTMMTKLSDSEMVGMAAHMHRMSNNSGHMMSMMRNMSDGIHLTGAVLVSPDHWLNFSSAVNEKASHWSLQAGVSLGLVALLILAAMAWVVRRALIPVKRLALAAQKAGQERDFSPLKLTGPAEITPTITAFNQMQLQLSNFIEDRTRMLAAISHDLRTPITTLRLRLEFIEQSEDQKQMHATLDQMEAMIKATLNFARDDAQQERSQSIELVSLLQTITDDYQDQGASIRLEAPPKLIYRLRPIAFRRAIENLLNNSLKYGLNSDLSNTSAQIQIVCEKNEHNIVIRVCDSGPGINEEALEEVFKPFIRLDKARDTSGSSVGLGLSIARTIIQAHGGTLRLRNLPQGGLCAEILLPVM